MINDDMISYKVVVLKITPWNKVEGWNKQNVMLS